MLQIGEAAREKGTGESGTFAQMFRLKSVHLLAVFILVYVGVEVTIGGVFLANSRSCSPGFHDRLYFPRVDCDFHA
jgi:fucose permease